MDPALAVWCTRCLCQCELSQGAGLLQSASERSPAAPQRMVHAHLSSLLDPYFQCSFRAGYGLLRLPVSVQVGLAYDWFLGITTSFTSTARSSLLCAAGWWSIGSLLEAPRRLVERRCGYLCDKLRQCHPLRAHFRLSWPVVSRLPAAWACLVRLVAWQLDSFDFSASLLR